MKSRFLTQDGSQIDPIPCQIKGFSLGNDRWCSRVDFSLFSQRNLTFKHSLDVESDSEEIGSKRFKDWGV